MKQNKQHEKFSWKWKRFETAYCKCIPHNWDHWPRTMDTTHILLRSLVFKETENFSVYLIWSMWFLRKKIGYHQHFWQFFMPEKKKKEVIQDTRGKKLWNKHFISLKINFQICGTQTNYYQQKLVTFRRWWGTKPQNIIFMRLSGKIQRVDFSIREKALNYQVNRETLI